jgi:hypothetical protein
MNKRDFYHDQSNSELFDRVVSLTSELPDDLYNQTGDVDYILQNIRDILDIIEDRAVLANTEEA